MCTGCSPLLLRGSRILVKTPRHARGLASTLAGVFGRSRCIKASARDSGREMGSLRSCAHSTSYSRIHNLPRSGYLSRGGRSFCGYKRLSPRTPRSLHWSLKLFSATTWQRRSYGAWCFHSAPYASYRRYGIGRRSGHYGCSTCGGFGASLSYRTASFGLSICSSDRYLSASAALATGSCRSCSGRITSYSPRCGGSSGDLSTGWSSPTSFAPL